MLTGIEFQRFHLDSKEIYVNTVNGMHIFLVCQLNYLKWQHSCTEE